MSPLIDGFLDGFTGAGMFFGPKPRQVSLLAEDSITAEEQWVDSMRELLQTVASRASAQQRSEVREELRKMVHRIPLTSTTAVESGSHR